MPAACQSSLLHPSTFAFRGFEGAKRQRLCQPSGNPLGPNLAGVSLFRMRAHRWCLWNGWCRTVLLRAVTSAQPMPAACQSFVLHPSTFAFEGAKQQRLCQPRAIRWVWILLGFPCFGWEVDVPLEWLLSRGAAQSRSVRPTSPCCLRRLPASSPVTLAAVTCLWNGCCGTVLLRAVTSAQPMPAACQSFLSPVHLCF